MATMTLEKTREAKPEQTERKTFEIVQNRVIRRVHELLGKPKNHFRTDAVKLPGNFYRVNVYCTVVGDRPVKSYFISDSFFVRYTNNGIISEPAIERRY